MTRKQIELAREKLYKTAEAVYSFAPNGNTPFSECLQLASEKVRARYEAARAKVDDLEHQAVAKGRAYRGSIGQLIFYR